MTLVIRECATAEEAFRYLEGLALQENAQFYFRGHRCESWDLGSTYSRHRKIPHEHWMPDLEEMIDHFIGSIISTGKRLPFETSDRRAKLEYARHYGLPSPLIDWTYSPYVAVFFAFNGTRDIGGRKKTRSVVYALDMNGLADLRARMIDKNRYGDLYNEFFAPLDFTRDYPGSDLRFLNFPASWNVRMTRQMGAFLYDTINYSPMGVSGLEQFIEKNTETPGPKTGPTLHKVFLPHTEGKGVFMRLDLAGITGTRLMDDYEGAVADAVNAYNYNRKSGYFWNIGSTHA